MPDLQQNVHQKETTHAHSPEQNGHGYLGFSGSSTISYLKLWLFKGVTWPEFERGQLNKKKKKDRD